MPLLKRVNFNEILTFDRNTDKTGFVLVGDGFGNQVPTLKTFAPNEPAKVIVDPLTKERLGISIHGQRTNFNVWSNNLTNLTAGASGTGEAPIVSFEGELFGHPVSTVVFGDPGSNGDSRLLGFTRNRTQGDNYTVSCVAQSLSGEQDLIVTIAGVGSKTVRVGESPTIIEAPVNWTLASGNFSISLRQSQTSLRTTGGFLIGFLQDEDGAFATPPIITSGTAVTRLADNCRILDIDQSDWWNPSEGTFVVDFIWEGRTAYLLGHYFIGMPVVDRYGVFITSTSVGLFWLEESSGTTAHGQTLEVGKKYRVSLTYTRGAGATAVFAETIVSRAQSNGDTINITQINFGRGIGQNLTIFNISNENGGTIKSVIYTPRAYSAEELQQASQLGA